MAKAKKTDASEAGATKKQATETKKAAPAADAGGEAPAAKATRAAASTNKAAASAEKHAAPAATKKKAAAKPAAGGAPASVPLIDTSLAAEAAAKFVMNRALLGNAAGGAATPAPAQEQTGDEAQAGDTKRETSAFKQLKAGLNKPVSQGLGGILGNVNAGKKGNTPFGGGQQVGRNQTFGADVNRSGVPRRTGG